VHEREKDIRYSSRTRLATNMIRERHEVRHAINELYKLVPPEFARTPQAKRLLDHRCITAIDIVQLIYRPDEPQGSLKDFEFSRRRCSCARSKALPTRGPLCRHRHGSRQCPASSVCAYSMRSTTSNGAGVETDRTG
jgi:hypothetical protein